MNQSDWKRHKLWWYGGVLVCLAVLAPLLSTYAYTYAQDAPAATDAVAAFDGPTTSSPITLAQDKNTVWVANPDDGSVTVLGTLDNPTILTTVKNVGKEPQAIALDTGVGVAQRAYVVSPPDNGVTVLKVNSVNPFQVVVEKRITTGAEPWNVVASPDGARIFVANSAQDTITIIRTDTQSIVGSIDVRNSPCNVDDAKRRFQPRGLAVTLDNTRLYVARFFSYTKPAAQGGVQGADGGKEGVVCQIDLPADIATVPNASTTPGAFHPVRLAPMPSGFRNPATGPEAVSHPNQMQSIVIYRDQAYLPNIGAATAAPDRFNVSTMAHVNVVDIANAAAPADAPTKSVNLHLGARVPEVVNGTPKKKLFFANPWAMAFRNNGGTVNAYAVSSGSDLLVKLNVDATGDLTFTVGVSTTRYIDLNDPANTATSGRNAGKNPLGIVIRNNRAFVMNYISRNVSVVDLDTDQVVNVIETTALPPANSFEEQLLVGREVFFSSRGHFDKPSGLTVSTEDRLSSEGWQNCASCHFAGGTDGNVWFFGSGPRKSVPLNATWSPHNPDDQRLLNYSAVFDEIQDFDLNVRNTSGPGALAAAQPCSEPAAGAATTSTLDPNHGLILGDVDPNKAPCVINQFLKPNANRNQVTVTLPGTNRPAYKAFDAMKEWVRFAIRTPEGALTADQIPGTNNDTGAPSQADVAAGRRLFFKANCQTCHGGTKWTISNKDFAAPPLAAELAVESPLTATGASQLQMFDRMLFEIGSFNLNVAGQGNILTGQPAIGAVELNNAGAKALGFDHNNDGKGNGYNIPALLGIGVMPPYYHNGACETLACVLSNQKHRTGNGQFTDVLANSADQAKLVAWLETLDSETPFPIDLSVRDHDIFFDPATVTKGAKVTIGANIQLFGTRADLTDILQGLGLTDIKVRIEADPGLAPVELSVPVSAFRQDFGQAVISTTWDVPANPSGSFGTVEVTIDPNNQLLENKEGNNVATRSKRLRNPAPDTVAPTISSVFISDNNPFDENDQEAASTNVKVKIQAADTGGSGLDSYCIVRYRYKQSERLWEPLKCNAFTPLPAAGSDGSFIVDAQLVDLAGITYAFVWVKDKAGNISNNPGFDVINLITANPVEMNRNDVRIFRFVLPAGSPLTLNFAMAAGDIDVSVFDHFRNPAQATRCAVSAQNGTVDEQVSLPGACAADTDDGRFRLQVEVRAVANSRFTISSEQVATVAVASVDTPDAANEATETITIGGAPLRAAIEDADDTATGSGNVYLPVVSK